MQKDDFWGLDYETKSNIALKILTTIMNQNEQAKAIYNQLLSYDTIPEKILDAMWTDYHSHISAIANQKRANEAEQFAASRAYIQQLANQEAQEDIQTEDLLSQII